jgi:hypothetical protein
MSSTETIIGEHEARLSALENGRVEQREDNRRIFSKLEEIAQSVAVSTSKPSCPDPGACMRLERAYVDQNRRLTLLEMAEQRKVGLIAGVTIIGAVIGWIMNLVFGR